MNRAHLKGSSCGTSDFLYGHGLYCGGGLGRFWVGLRAEQREPHRTSLSSHAGSGAEGVTVGSFVSETAQELGRDFGQTIAGGRELPRDDCVSKALLRPRRSPLGRKPL